MITIEDFTSFVIDRRAKGQPHAFAKIAEVLNTLIWVMDDNGTDIGELIDSWLRGDDEARIEVALAVELIPFRDEVERKSELERIAERWPRFAARCEYLANYKGFS